MVLEDLLPFPSAEMNSTAKGDALAFFLCWALSLYLSKPFQKPRAWARVVAEADCLSLAVAQELRMVYIS